jgi:hypothetical protein
MFGLDHPRFCVETSSHLKVFLCRPNARQLMQYMQFGRAINVVYCNESFNWGRLLCDDNFNYLGAFGFF